MPYTVAFVGCPNVGKSTVFNALTGLRQHTGNWTGKTVDPARGRWSLDGLRWEAVDLPGIYALAGGTPEERVAADWLAAHRPDVLVVVLDATALERSLALALELRARFPADGTTGLLLCLNLTDEAERLGLALDGEALSRALACPVVPTRADRRETYERLRRTIAVLSAAPQLSLPGQCAQRRQSEAPVPQSAPIRDAAALAAAVTKRTARPRRDWDRLLLGKWTAYPLVLLLLFVLFYLTVRGANLPSALLERAFDRLGALLARALSGLPPALRSLLLEGIYGTAAKVTAVMLPPMAIFFPLFSLLEDLGWLPRAALLLDRPFAACGSCGRQGLCMCMGLGCNAVGVTGCRIIPNERERLAAIVTNALTPCNGRFPTLILLAGLLLNRGGERSPLAAAGLLTLCLLLSGGVTLLVTALLRKTLLKGEGTSFLLELPPFRRPRLGRLLLRSLLDRSLRVLGRALCVAAPAGAMIWLLNRLRIGGAPLLTVLARGLEPCASLLGLTGTLLLAFALSFPANELLLPLALLIAGRAGGDPAALFTLRTALCAALFTLFHWPCSTTVLTVYHETKSLRWTALAVLVPTLAGLLLCALTNGLFVILS
ncbi:MAG: ferrous iron transporter B [Oscillospiraceae bacterium]|nr:ferrous iron transporter B [Oscillospiraceae bacterium]MBR4656302.1 ferrous iron transporter B [Oscillospiraceae bacterium]